MIKAAILLIALLLSATVPGGHSSLVSTGHTHKWTMIHSDEEVTIWHGTAWSSSYDQNPLILVRLQSHEDEEMSHIDMRMAVDCKGKRIGLRRSEIVMKADDKRYTATNNPVEYDLTSDPLSEQDLALLAAACPTTDSE